MSTKAQGRIIVDGILNESDWQRARHVSEFTQHFPYDTSQSVLRTEVKTCFDAEYLYISAKCYRSEVSDEFVIQSLRRDFSTDQNDGFTVFLDPLSTKNNGFVFSVSSQGVQREGLMSDGGNWGVSNDWDNVWYSEVSHDSTAWYVEMAIPFSTIRYSQDKTEWLVNFSRTDLGINERSVWAPVPRNFNVSTLAFTGKLIFEQPLSTAKTVLTLIPFLAGSTSKNYRENAASKESISGGFDAKIPVTSSLNLDLTVNPDFAQADVDQQVTNLNRFSIFFPERRQFFIENSDLFSRFGFSRIRPFFSRQIGLYNGAQIPIIAGGRLSGQVNQDWRIGALAMQTAAVDSLALSSQNYAVVAVQRRVFERSNIGLIAVNRQGENYFNKQGNNYNRVLGLDYNLYSADGEWTGKFFYHRLFTPESQKGQYAQAGWLSYSTPGFGFDWNHEVIGENYRPEVGFVPRTGVLRLEPWIGKTWFPSSTLINNHQVSLYMDMYTTLEREILDRVISANYFVKFQNTSSFSFSATHEFTQLTFPFDITGKNNKPLDIGKYNWEYVSASYTSDFRPKISGSVSAQTGSYFNGNRTVVSGSLGYRFQPYGSVRASVEQNEIRTPQGNASLSLFKTTFDISFSRSVFVTSFLQYNTQIDNLSVYARLQWRFAPMSDVFLVYTDNVDTQNFAIKTRSIILKINYWFNAAI